MRGSNSRKCDYPQRALKNKGIVDSRCFRHMTEPGRTLLKISKDYNGLAAVALVVVKGILLNSVVKSDQDGIQYARTPQQNGVAETKNRPLLRSENQANKHAGPKEANHSAGTQDNIDAGKSKMKRITQDYFVLPIWSSYTSTVKSSEAKNEGEKPY
ncbi:hypothetical protein Tco_1246091 [Tanacetum coccineum]